MSGPRHRQLYLRIEEKVVEHVRRGHTFDDAVEMVADCINVSPADVASCVRDEVRAVFAWEAAERRRREASS